MSSLPFQLIHDPFLHNTSPPSSLKKENRPCPLSLPDLIHPKSPVQYFTQSDDSSLEGVTANVKLVLKLLQEQKEACSKDDDGRNLHRLVGMLSILDDVRGRIELCSHRSAGCRDAELRRCNTDLLRHSPSSPGPNAATSCGGAFLPRGTTHRGKLPSEPSASDEYQTLRRELSASMTARKSLEKMFSSLGREMEMIAAELARKVQELSCMEELVGDLRAQNEMLSDKVRACAAEHRGGCGEEVKALREKNRELSEQLLRSLDGYKTAKRRLREAQEEAARAQAAAAAAGAAGRLRRASERNGEGDEAELEKEWA